MRLIRYLVLAIIAIVLICVAMANRDLVTLNLLPQGLRGAVPFETSMTLPLFVILIACVAVGLIIGFIWEWLREMKLRGAARKEHKQVVRLQRELDRLKAEKAGDVDDIVALLGDGR